MDAAALATDAEAALRRLADVCPQVREAGPGDSVDGVPAALVARPESTQQTADVMRAAAASGLAVVVRGRATKLSWGLPPRRLDLLLDTTALDAVVDHAAGDLIVEAQAGARLRDVQAVVAGAGQRLAVDETAPGASLGGTLATAASGPLRLAAGTMRDLLIGVTFVRADGVVAHAGGRVVKNVAGYDLGKVLVGSLGTLGVVTQAVFRLHPLPQAQAVVTLEADGPAAVAQAERAAQTALHSQVVPAAIEVEMSGGVATVSVLLEGSAAGVRARAGRLAELLGDGARTVDQPPPGWGRYPWEPGGTGLKVTFAASGLADVLAVVAAATESHEHPGLLRGSAGAGVVHVGLPASTPPEAVSALLSGLRGVCARHGGAATLVDGPAAVKSAVDVWGPVGGLELMRALKDRFDPGHRLAPGRFVGGI